MSRSSMQARLDRVRGAIAKRPLTGVVLAAVVGVLIAAAVAIPMLASKSSEVDDLNASLAANAAELERVEGERDRAERVADAITSRRDQIISSAKEQAEGIVGDAKQKAADLNDQLQQAQSDLESTQGKLDSVNAELQQAQTTQEMSTFSDGTWAVGAEITAGTYRSTAGGSCYWEILNSPSGGGINNIVDNGFGPNATITVATGQWLHVDGCGTWSPGP